MTRISPWLSVADATAAVGFYTAAFGAEVRERVEGEPGVVEVANLAVGEADFWAQRDPDAAPRPADPASRPGAAPGSPVRMILTVDDPDAVFAASLAAGATKVAPVREANGWRVGRLLDPCGHEWEIGHPL